MVYIICLAFVVIVLFLAIDKGTSRNVGRLLLVLLGLLAFAVFLAWQLIQKAR